MFAPFFPGLFLLGHYFLETLGLRKRAGEIILN